MPEADGARFAFLFVLGMVLAGCTVNTSTGRSSSCHADPGVGGCEGGHGYTCASGARPDQTDPSLACGAATIAGLGATYCCYEQSMGCVEDPTLSCSAASTGYDCYEGVSPDVAFPGLTCSTPIGLGIDGSSYCCSAGSTHSPPQPPSGDGCVADSTITGCPAGAEGYLCTDTPTPSQANPGLLCQPPTQVATGFDYCCFATTGTTCASDPTLTVCSAGSDPYACTELDSPEQDTNMGLVCSPGMPGTSGTTTYCCTTP
jgi:hypothetical protein